MSSRPSFHAVTWLVWALAAAACVQLAPGPAYVLVTIAIAAVVAEGHNAGGALSRAFPVMVMVGVVFGLVKVALTVATTHGVGTTLFVMPEVTLPRLLGGFTVGGTVEAAVAAQAASEALAIVGIMAVFGAFNAVVAHDELVLTFPRTFHEPGLVLTVGLAFVPATISSVRAVQESDRSRTGGTVVRRGRLLRLAVPLLESGMERAVTLSESMDSRGFARQEPSAAERGAGWLALLGLLSLAGVLVALVGSARGLAWALFVAGGALLAAAVWVGSRGSARPRYRPRRFGTPDVVVVACALAAVTGLVLLSAVGVEGLRWDTSSPGLPPFSPAVGAVLLLLVAPALRPGATRRRGP